MQELALNRKAAPLAFPNPQARMQHMTIETSKIHDGIFVKYGLRVQYLNQAFEHFGFKSDSEI